MKDIIESRNRALRTGKWIFGERLHRIGNPFEWLDGENNPMLVHESNSFGYLQNLSMFYDPFPTPKEIITTDYEEMKTYLESNLRRSFQYFIPFLDPARYGFEKHISCTALVRLQDYCFLKTSCKDLHPPLHHLDLGAGVGAAALYSLKAFCGSFYALEAIPTLYSVQRNFFHFLSLWHGLYLDVIDCENFSLERTEIEKLVNENSTFKIKHIPSWYLDCVKDGSIDLMTATWILNEINTAGVLWLISNASRILRRDGYFYVRDGGRLRPGGINYDQLLLDLGFLEVKRLNVKNRVNMQGIPRVYQKKNDSNFSFDELVKKCLGKFDAPVHQKYGRVSGEECKRLREST